MKRYLWLKIVGVTVSLYALIGFFGVPYIIEKVAPQKILEATDGGNFSVGSASFNPFTFRLVVDKFSFKTPQNGDFIAIHQFIININPVEYLWQNALVVERVSIVNPTVFVSKDSEGVMNFKWLISGEEDENVSKKPSEPLALLIRDFTLTRGEVEYVDKSEGRDYRQAIDDLGFHLENINLREMGTSHGKTRLYATINHGGFVDVNGKINTVSPFNINGSVAFNSGKLYTPWKYFAHKLPIEVADGSVHLKFDYSLNTDDINATKLSHLSTSLKALRIIPKGGKETLFALNSLELDDATVYPLKKQLESASVRLSGIQLNASRNPDGSIDWVNYLDEINRAFPEDENETKVPWNYTVKEVAVDGVNIGWNDHAPKSPYAFTLKNLSVHTRALSSDEKAPLNLNVGIGEMKTVRQGDAKTVLSSGALGIDTVKIYRDTKSAVVGNISLDNPFVTLKRLKDGTLDYEQYMYQRKAVKAVESTPWSYRIETIALKDGKIDFVDEVPKKNVPINLTTLNFEMKNLTSNPKNKINLALSTLINDKGSFKLNSEVVREPLRSHGNFALTGIDISPFDTYLEPSTYASLHRGMLSLAGTYAYTKETTTLKGKLGLADWVVDDRRDNAVLVGWQNIGVTPFIYTYPQNRLKVKMIAVNGLYANVIVDANKTLNFSTLSKSRPVNDTAKEQAQGNPFGVDIVKLVINDGSANFSDLSLPLLFKTYIHDLGGEVLGISTTQDVVTYVKLSGGVDAYGMAKINGKLNTKAPKDFTDIHVNFDNLELKQYTPYSLEFLGYKIKNGKLYLNLGYVIDHGKLNGKNQVIIKQIELGEEKAGGAQWPLGLVVALLEDSDGVIDIDMPIEGDINNPDFKYGTVVWQVIGNLMTKAITSPFRLLGSLMGLDSEDDSLSAVGFEAGEAILLPPEREKLDKLTAVLIKRPKLTLTVHGGWEIQADDRALRLQKLIASVLGNNKKASTHEAMSIEYLEITAKKSLDTSTIKELRASMEKKYPNESDFVQHYSAALIDRLIEKQVIAPPEMGALATQRAQVVVAYLHQNPVLISRVTLGASEKSTLDDKQHISSRMELSVK